jgi:hypothetical protein
MQKDVYDTMVFIQKLSLPCTLIIKLHNGKSFRYNAPKWWPGPSIVAQSVNMHNVHTVEFVKFKLPKFSRTILYHDYVEKFKDSYKKRVIIPYLAFKPGHGVDRLVASIMLEKLEEEFAADFFQKEKYLMPYFKVNKYNI